MPTIHDVGHPTGAGTIRKIDVKLFLTIGYRTPLKYIQDTTCVSFEFVCMLALVQIFSTCESYNPL